MINTALIWHLIGLINIESGGLNDVWKVFLFFFCVNRHHVGTGAAGVQVKVILRIYSALWSKQDHFFKKAIPFESNRGTINDNNQTQHSYRSFFSFYCGGNYICVPFNLICLRAIKRAVKSRIPATVSKTKFLQRILHSHAHLHPHARTHARTL